MPQAVTHVIIALIVASLLRDVFIRKKKKSKFPLHYVLIAGISALLPDIDIAAFFGLQYFGFALNEVHRTFTHTLFVPLLFFVLAIVFWKFHNKELGKHHMTFHGILLMISLGSFIHLGLDAGVAGRIMPFYPLSSWTIGFSMLKYIPSQFQNLFFPSLDAFLLVLWLIYMEARHRISDFI